MITAHTDSLYSTYRNIYRKLDLQVDQLLPRQQRERIWPGDESEEPLARRRVLRHTVEDLRQVGGVRQTTVHHLIFTLLTLHHTAVLVPPLAAI